MGGVAAAGNPAEPALSLVSRVLAGDPAAERELYDAHVDRVYRLAYRMTGDSHRAEEYTQDALVRVFERLGSYRGEAALSTWITSVALSVILNGIRTTKRRREREDDLERADRMIAIERRTDPDLKDRLRAAVDELPEGYRVTFLMHDVEGYTHQEIAGVLGVQEGTSKANLSRARARLRVALADFAGAWE
ncbi:MAG: RNA polymerase sigma factor [Gemmatimonadales bacterium]